ncbi:PilZ domain-containing protein [Vibrio amylolyticus]|uniref:PilZ domain-containing protein n=2 Tax=Vibrio amylolyticus TaxID=2847292 RepID=UPI00354DFB69
MTTDTPETRSEKAPFTAREYTAYDFRMHPRMPMKRVNAQVKRKSFLSKYFAVELIDISKGGLGLECRTKIEVGEKVDIKLGSRRLTGVVVYMRQILGSRDFKLGVRFDEALGISDMLYIGAPTSIAFS